MVFLIPYTSGSINFKIDQTRLSGTYVYDIIKMTTTQKSIILEIKLKQMLLSSLWE